MYRIRFRCDAVSVCFVSPEGLFHIMLQGLPFVTLGSISCLLATIDDALDRVLMPVFGQDQEPLIRSLARAAGLSTNVSGRPSCDR